ncbi:hypothetical protein JXB41_02705 [Candidatus Woesearchaeota archaeon]|nr:hypothetical protein [Candidatus Woesearchaeota archaeon]
MNVAIIVSEKDKAGLNIKDSLLNLYDFKKINNIFELKNTRLYTLKKDTIFAENIDKEINAELFIFATKHKSASKRPTLSLHTPGNYSKAEFGGSNKKLCISHPVLMKTAFIELNKNAANLHHEVTLECTHHGPYLEKPCMFIEIGSCEEEWIKKPAGDVIAKTIIKTIETFQNKSYKTAIGFGGTHYCPNFNRIMLDSETAIGHICPKYMFHELDEELIMEMINKSAKKPDIVLLDWKGLGKEKQKLLDLLKELKLDYKKTKEIN